MPNLLCKADYLSSSDVDGFITYLVGLLDGDLEFSHAYRVRDARLPEHHRARLNVDRRLQFCSLESAFNNYWWANSDYDENKQALERVQEIVRETIDVKGTERPDAVLNALREVLGWGAGYRRTKLYTANLKWASDRADSLAERLRAGREAMVSDTPNLAVFDPRQEGCARMNAGYTKYYALACEDVVIYDGRVGAALGLLARHFCKASKLPRVPHQLQFGWGAQSGKNPLNRNPSDSEFSFGRLPVEGAIWAAWNIKANWVLSSARRRAQAKWCKGDDGLRRIEAALFVIGYEIPMSNEAG